MALGNIFKEDLDRALDEDASTLPRKVAGFFSQYFADLTASKKTAFYLILRGAADRLLLDRLLLLFRKFLGLPLLLEDVLVVARVASFGLLKKK